MTIGIVTTVIATLSIRGRDDRDRGVRDGGFRDAGYHERDFRDRASLEQPVSHRTWRNDSRPLSRDGQMESPFYN